MRDGRPISNFVEDIFLDHPNIPETMSRFESRTNATRLVSSGEPPDVVLIVEFDKADQAMLKAAKRLVTLERDSEVSAIEIEFSNDLVVWNNISYRI